MSRPPPFIRRIQVSRNGRVPSTDAMHSIEPLCAIYFWCMMHISEPNWPIIDAWSTALSRIDAWCTAILMPDAQLDWCLMHSIELLYWCLIAISHGCTALSHNYLCMMEQYWAILMPYSWHWTIIDVLCTALGHIDTWCTALSQPDTNGASMMLVAEQDPAWCMLHCMPTWRLGVPG